MAENYPPELKRPLPGRWLLGLLVLVTAALAANHYAQWYPWPWAKPDPSASSPADVSQPSSTPRLIDYDKIKDESDLALGQIIDQRKNNFGLTNSVDMVVVPNESIRVGQETVSVADILNLIEGQAAAGFKPENLPLLEPPGTRPLVEQEIKADSPAYKPKIQTSVTRSVTLPDPNKRKDDFYGIYVVRQGDNLWNVHFAFLREYLQHRDINVSDRADEGVGGRSTGVSRILKYAERMVHIFNMKTKRLDSNIHLLEPESKVIIFNLSNLHRILGSIKPGQLDRVRFDGRELYIMDSETTAANTTQP